MVAFDEISPRIKLSVGRDGTQAVFGRGVAMLCRGVRDTGSLNKAAKNLSMAYSKAWRIMKQTEESFGFQLLNRDGAHGSTLTEKGETLLALYEELECDVDKYAAKRLGELVSKLS